MREANEAGGRCGRGIRSDVLGSRRPDGYFIKGDEMSELMSAIQHPAGVWRKPPGWPTAKSRRRRLFWPILGGLLALSLLAVIVLFPSVLVPILGIVTGLISMIYGLR